MSHPVSEKSALVVSAHSADFVWRAGGAIALHALQGYQVHVVCLSFGERGESAKLWRKGNMTEEAVKQVRREEAQAAAAIGASVEFFDIGDYPLRADKETLFRLADVYRRIQPHFVLTHSLQDPYNYDHRPPIWRRKRGLSPQRAIAPVKIVAAPRFTVSNRTSRSSATGNPMCYWTSPPSGRKVSGHSVHAGSGASVGILHPRGAAGCRPSAISASRPRAISFTAKPSRASSPRNGERMNLLNKRPCDPPPAAP